MSDRTVYRTPGWLKLLGVGFIVVALAGVLTLPGHPRQPASPVLSPAGRLTPTFPGLPAGWSPLGEPGVGGRITGLAIDPSNPQDIVVGGDILGVGVSADGGRSWQPTSGFASWEINAFTWNPVAPRDVWVGTLSGPYESRDAGHTWAPMRVGLPTGDYPYSAPIQKVLIDPTNPEHLLAFGGNQRELVAAGTGALHYGLVYESTDAGRRWTTIADLGTNWNILDVAAAAGNLQTLYCAIAGHGVYRSVDDGHSWSPVDAGLPNREVKALAVDPQQPGTLWAAIAHDPAPVQGVYHTGGIYQTTDGGQSWHTADGGIPRISSPTAVNATSMDSVLRAGDGTLYTADQGYSDQNRYESTDGGAHWTLAGGPVASFYPAAATPSAWASSSDGAFVIGGTSDTLIASTDRGHSWRDVSATPTPGGAWSGSGFSGLLGTRAAFARQQPNVVLLTAFDGGNLLRSSDGGASWTRPLADWDNYGGGYDVETGGSGGEVVYAILGQAGAFNGIAVSRDAGRTWTYQVGGRLPARHTVGAGVGSVAVADLSGASAYAVLPDQQLYVTHDTGATWTRVPLDSAVSTVTSTPGRGRTYVGTTAGIWEITGSAGTPHLLNGSPGSMRRLALAPDGAIYASGPLGDGQQSGLWSNQTGTWRRTVSDPWVMDVTVDPVDRRRVVYVSNDNPYHDTSFATGVWVSCDAGRSFTPDNSGLPMLRGLSVTFDPVAPGRLTVGLNGRGFWQVNLPAC